MIKIGYSTKALRNKLLKIYQCNEELILNKWLRLVEYNIDIQDDSELKALIKLFKRIIVNYINYFKNGNIMVYCSNTINFAEEMASKDFSYNKFKEINNKYKYLQQIECESKNLKKSG